MASIDQLERKILELERQLDVRTEQMDALLRKSELALDQSMHAYQLDAFGYLWAYNPKTKTYHKTKMRVATPEICDKMVKTRNLADGAVTSEKLTDYCVTNRNLAPGAVDESKLVLSDVAIEMNDDTGDIMAYYFDTCGIDDVIMDADGDIIVEITN